MVCTDAWLLSHPPQDRPDTGPRLAEQFPSWVVAVCSGWGGTDPVWALRETVAQSISGLCHGHGGLGEAAAFMPAVCQS